MKKFLSMLLMAAGLMSCGDDDKPFIPELNKLTSVTCTKNGNAFFNANITYDQDKQINRIILNTEGNQFTDNYIIVDKTISVSGVKMIDGSPTDPFVHTVYTLSGNMEMRCIMLICHRKRLHMNIILNYVQRTFRSELSIHFNRSALM